jgi:hypothetical protein
MSNNRTVPRDIIIRPCLNGYVVNVGCQVVVFNDRKRLLEEIGIYLDRPGITEDRYRETAVHREMMNNLAPGQPGVYERMCVERRPQAQGDASREEAINRRAEETTPESLVRIFPAPVTPLPQAQAPVENRDGRR